MRTLKMPAFLLLVIFVLVTYLYIDTTQLETRLAHNIEYITIHHTFHIAKNIESIIKEKTRNTKDLYNTLKYNPYLRKDIEDALSILITPIYQYIYVVYRDKKGRFRYLLDGSRIDRGEFDQKIDVSPKWNQIFKTKAPLLIKHHKLQTLWITYLYPIIQDNKIQALIAIDFSPNFRKTLHRTLKPISFVISFIFATITFLILMLLYQLYVSIKAKQESFIDPLTGAYNRTFLREFFKQHTLSKYAILMLDIDHFKQINDNYGHKAGDTVLREIVQNLKKSLREKDILIRYGGEEFLIFIEKSNNTNIINLAERIRKRVESTPFYIEDYKLHITISIGINLHPEHFKDQIKAIKYADEMLYIAKRSGRNQIIYQPPKTSSAQQSLSINNVQEAIEEGGLFCQFQPIVDLQSSQTLKYEALVRLRYNKRIFYPNQFLEDIEFTTVYTILTQKVLETVFAKITTTGSKISVNLKFSDILDNKLFSTILQTIQKNQALAPNLTIELLENEALYEKEQILAKLEQLKTYGIQIALDDFGTGYSNFTIFEELPIDILKIDGSLIRSINDKKISYNIVKAIASFAKDINVQVVAEFVENEDIVQILRKLGIHYAQGYYFSKPIDL